MFLWRLRNFISNYKFDARMWYRRTIWDSFEDQKSIKWYCKRATPDNRKYFPLFPLGKIETFYASPITILRVIVPRIRARKVYTLHFSQTDSYIHASGTTERTKSPCEKSTKTEIVEIYIPDSRHIRAWRHRKLMVRWIYSRVWYIRACRAYLVTPRLTISPLVPLARRHTRH